jgi:4-hydroxybenzoate polyprenyltransferase
MRKSRFYRLFRGFYEQYLIAIIFMALTPAVFYERPLESVLALVSIALGTLADIAINRVYDADDDAIEEWKSRSNPISRGEIAKDTGWMICVNIYFISIIVSLLTGDIVFSFILAVRNLLGFLYSGPPVRAKSSPGVDVLFHLGIIDSGPAFIALAYTRNFSPLPLYLLGFLALNSMFTQVSQELRDYQVDGKAGLKTTVQALGYGRALTLQRALLVLMGLYVMAAGFYNGMTYIAGAAAVALAHTIHNLFGDHSRMHSTRRNSVIIMAAGLAAQAVKVF